MRFVFELLFLVACLRFYFYLAERFNLFDNPNRRSSHSNPTIRGGGIIFPIALVLYFLLNHFKFPWFVAGALIISFVSFSDDIKAVPVLVRLSLQLIAFWLMNIEVTLFDHSWWIITLVFLVGIGTLNAFNFMDGINGITGIYSLVTLLSFLLINRRLTMFSDDELILFLSLAVGVFLFYNFRTRARCFAGDVGSLSIAFALLFLLLQLITSTSTFGWLLLFLVYGVDSTITIVYRLANRENLFKAHRSHLYQYLANEIKLPHQVVSAGYGVLQAAINLAVVYYLGVPTFAEAVTITIIFALIYIGIREWILNRLGKRGLIAHRFSN